MRFVLALITFILLIGCGPVPDSTGKVYVINPEEARKQLYESLDELIIDDEEHHEAFYRRSKLFYEDKKYDKSLSDITNSIKLEPTSNSYLAHKIRVLSALKRHVSVIRLLKGLPDEYYDESIYKAKLIAEIRTGKIKNPELIEESLEDLGISKGLENYLKGMASWKRKDTVQADLFLKKAYALGEKEKDLLLTLMQIHPLDSSSHIIYLKTAAEIYKNQDIQLQLAKYYIRNNRAEEGDSIYDLLLTKKPSDLKVQLLKSDLLIEQQRYSEVLDLFEKDYVNTSSRADDKVVADSYFFLRRNNEAKDIYDAIIDQDTTGSVRKNLSVIRWRFNQKKKLSDSLTTIAKDSVNSNP